MTYFLAWLAAMAIGPIVAGLIMYGIGIIITTLLGGQDAAE